MEFQEIAVEIRTNGIAIMTLNRPKKKNAINIRMRREISACLNMWKERDDVGLVIITGAEATFSAGFDLKDFENPDQFDELLESSSRYHRDVWHFPKPVIAAIDGPAMGGGFDLATLCDIRICSDSAIFGHPEVKFGAPPIFTPLRWIVGDGMARDLCLTGRRIDAQEAFRIGLVSEVVEGNNVLSRAIEIGSSILEAPRDTLQFAKSFFTGHTKMGFDESFDVEHDRAFQEVLLPKAKKGFK